MLYGWVNGQSERLTGDTDWNANSEDEDIYYLGSWEDGAMKTGWQRLTVCEDVYKRQPLISINAGRP